MNLPQHFCNVREEKGISVCRPLSLERQAAAPTRQKEETSSDQIEAFVQVGLSATEWNKIKSAVRLCARARLLVLTFKVPVCTCLWTGVFCLHCVQSCQENIRLGRRVCRRLVPRPRAASCCAFKDISQHRDHRANETNTLAIKHTLAYQGRAAKPRQLARSPGFRRHGEPRSPTALDLCRDYAPRASCKSVAQINWGQFRLRLRSEEHCWPFIVYFLFRVVSYFLCGVLQETSEQSCRTATWACSSHLTQATAGDRWESHRCSTAL